MPCIASQRLACIARRAAQPQLSSRNCPVRAARFISAPCLPLSDSSRSSADEEHLLVGNSYSSGLATRETTAHQQAQLMPRPPPPPPSVNAVTGGVCLDVSRRHAAPVCRTSLADRNAIASAVPIPTPSRGSAVAPPVRPDPPRASRQPQPGARRARSVQRRCSACSPSARKRLKSPLVRSGASASGLSLSDGSMRIELVG